MGPRGLSSMPPHRCRGLSAGAGLGRRRRRQNPRVPEQLEHTQQHHECAQHCSTTSPVGEKAHQTLALTGSNACKREGPSNQQAQLAAAAPQPPELPLALARAAEGALATHPTGRRGPPVSRRFGALVPAPVPAPAPVPVPPRCPGVAEFSARLALFAMLSWGSCRGPGLKSKATASSSAAGRTGVLFPMPSGRFPACVATTVLGYSSGWHTVKRLFILYCAICAICALYRRRPTPIPLPRDGTSLPRPGVYRAAGARESTVRRARCTAMALHTPSVV